MSPLDRIAQLSDEISLLCSQLQDAQEQAKRDSETIARLAKDKRELEQESGELCQDCGWRMRFPQEPCRCELQRELEQTKARLAKWEDSFEMGPAWVSASLTQMAIERTASDVLLSAIESIRSGMADDKAYREAARQAISAYSSFLSRHA